MITDQTETEGVVLTVTIEALICCVMSKNIFSSYQLLWNCIAGEKILIHFDFTCSRD